MRAITGDRNIEVDASENSNSDEDGANGAIGVTASDIPTLGTGVLVFLVVVCQCLRYGYSLNMVVDTPSRHESHEIRRHRAG